MRFVLLLGLVALTQATVYFKEDFGAGWEDRWVQSGNSDLGKVDVTAGDWYGDAEADKGLHTTQDAKFYGISAKFDEFSNEEKDLVVQFSVKHQQKIDCGGGYVKLLPAGLDHEKFDGESEYNIMFGPDICGSSTKKVHVILNYKGENHLIKQTIPCETDQLTHVYTLIIHPDQTYDVRIDGESKRTGNLVDDWDFLPSKKIKDPSVSKPEDWVDEAMIDDPEDVKPEGYDDLPKMIADPEAEKPEDWDDEEDGEWEPPMIDNPEYKGPWHPKRIANPDYKGPWEHPMIDNPEFEMDKNIYKFKSFGAVGFDLWQVKSGTIFDNILITDDVAEAEALIEETWGAHHEAEKEMFDEAEKARREQEEEERKEREEEAKRVEDEEEMEDEEDVEEEDIVIEEAPADKEPKLKEEL